MKFSDLQGDQLDLHQLSELKGGATALTVGCTDNICTSAMESLAGSLCKDAVCSSHAA